MHVVAALMSGTFPPHWTPSSTQMEQLVPALSTAIPATMAFVAWPTV